MYIHAFTINTIYKTYLNFTFELISKIHVCERSPSHVPPLYLITSFLAQIELHNYTNIALDTKF